MQNFSFEKVLSFEIGCDVMLLLIIGDPFIVFALCHYDLHDPGHGSQCS